MSSQLIGPSSSSNAPHVRQTGSNAETFLSAHHCKEPYSLADLLPPAAVSALALSSKQFTTAPKLQPRLIRNWLINVAISTANTIQNPYMKDKALEGILIEQARQGDIEGAKTTANSILNQDNKGVAFWEIAIEQAKQGDFKGATSTANLIPRKDIKNRALKSIAIEQAKSGNIEEGDCSLIAHKSTFFSLN